VGNDVASRVVAVGASAGGVEALRGLVAGLPEDLDAAVLVVLHLPASAKSVLPEILARAAQLAVAPAHDGEELTAGRILVAIPDHHLVVHDGHIRLLRGPRVNGHRPAIDPLFVSAARTFGPAALGILLSGTLDDGVNGLLGIRDRGGSTAAQDPHEAAYPDMPENAIRAGAVDHVADLRGLAELIVKFAHEPPHFSGPIADPTDSVETEVSEVGELSNASTHPGDPRGKLVDIACPNCGGSLWASDDGNYFECRTGHAYSAESLVEVQADAVDDALWGAYRALLEQADLNARMARRVERLRGVRSRSQSYRHTADDALRRAEVLRAVLMNSASALKETHAGDNRG
jgi:two-component system chemotaxis response regulator CheB